MLRFASLFPVSVHPQPAPDVAECLRAFRLHDRSFNRLKSMAIMVSVRPVFRIFNRVFQHGVPSAVETVQKKSAPCSGFHTVQKPSTATSTIQTER